MAEQGIALHCLFMLKMGERYREDAINNPVAGYGVAFCR